MTLLGDQYDNKAQHANNRGLSHGNIVRVTYTVSGGLARKRILYCDSIRICYRCPIVVIRVFSLLHCTGVLLIWR